MRGFLRKWWWAFAGAAAWFFFGGVIGSTLCLSGCGDAPDPCKTCRDRGFECGSRRLADGEVQTYCLVPMPPNMIPHAVPVEMMEATE